MKTDLQLHFLLQSWQVHVELPPNFQRDVWRRIANRAPAREHWLDRFSAWLSPAFSLPQLATAVALAAVVAGISLGGWQGRESASQNWSRLEVRYADSINPLSATHWAQNP